jgi:hypothetical protein
MKLFNYKQMMINAVYMAYKWGYQDKENNLPLKSYEEVEKSFNKGFNKKQ